MLAYITDWSDFAAELAARMTEKGCVIASGDELYTLDAPVDIFIATENERSAADNFTVTDGIDPTVIMEAVHRNISLPMQKLERAIPLMDRGQLKRICFLSSADASVNMSNAVTGFGYCMSKAALHNALAIIKNRLYKEGYTFRLFDPLTDGREPHVTAAMAAYTAADYFLSGLGYDPNDYENGQNEERRLTLRDALGREWPW